MRSRRLTLLIFSVFLTGSVVAEEILDGHSPLIFKRNGGWCWFQDPRALLRDDFLVFSSVAARERDGSAPGDIEVTSCDLATGELQHFKLHPRLQPDDHDVPALLILPDQRILASYMMHGNESLMRWRITENPLDVSRWTPEDTFDVHASLS